MKLPKCPLKKSCKTISYMIKSTPSNNLKSDIFVCSRCANSVFVKEEVTQIPAEEEILECLSQVEFYLVRIDQFEQGQGGFLWRMKKGERVGEKLEEYFEEHRLIKAHLFTATNTEDYSSLPYIHIESKHLLNTILESEIFKEYNHQKEFMKFRDFTDNLIDPSWSMDLTKEREDLTSPDHPSKTRITSISLTASSKLHQASKAFINQQICNLRDYILTTEHSRVISKLADTKKLVKSQAEQISAKDLEIEDQKRKLTEKDQEIKHIQSKLLTTESQLAQISSILQQEQHKNELNERIIQEQKEEIERVLHEKKACEEVVQKIQMENKEVEKAKSMKVVEIEKLETIMKEMEDEGKRRETIISTLVASKDPLIHPRSLPDLKGGSLYFNFSSVQDHLLMGLLVPHKLPSLASLKCKNLKSLSNPEVHLKETPCKFPVLNDFLEDSIQDEIRELSMTLSSGNDLSDESDFTEMKISIAKVLPMVTKQVSLSGFVISQEEFVTFMSAAKKAREIRFNWCRLDIENDCEFEGELEDSKFRILNFYGTELVAPEGWFSDGCEKFRYIMKGLSKEHCVKKRNIIVKLEGCGLKRDKVAQILTENSMTLMKIEM
ncbi:unnamed protein product [Moneuplotes crassus]|uniref:Uncharacterized protein n=1 Tax=Euplotes crassus TaxID=5936 RepID=A0AAD1Y813_EUPCR|nr:unnamed protein product [Moneuplotes crassus]